jgi:hypothetical protein
LYAASTWDKLLFRRANAGLTGHGDEARRIASNIAKLPNLLKSKT